MSNSEFEKLSLEIAIAARELGVNCFLGPILDVVIGENPWLIGRTWSTDPIDISRISSVYMKTVKSNGIAATAKHFLGYSNIALDPDVAPEAEMTAPLESFEKTLLHLSMRLKMMSRL